MIELKDVCAGYGGEEKLHSISLSFSPKKITILLGPNGCGKSTLLKTAAGLHPLMSGAVFLNGKPIEGYSPRQLAHKISYLPQSRNVSQISVKQLILHGRFAYLSYPRRYRPEDRRAAEEAMEQIGIRDLAEKPVNQLSGGERQKVYIAMALAQNADTVFWDEPTTYLDIGHQLEIMDMILKLKEQGKAVALVLHDLNLALQYADFIVLMNSGTVETISPPAEVAQSGLLTEVFGVQVEKVRCEDNWQYYFKLPKRKA